jgi:hypothetical protein
MIRQMCLFRNWIGHISCHSDIHTTHENKIENANLS